MTTHGRVTLYGWATLIALGSPPHSIGIGKERKSEGETKQRRNKSTAKGSAEAKPVLPFCDRKGEEGHR